MIKIRVPATSANIGPGFDALGLALDLYNVFEFEESDRYSCESSVNDTAEDNLILKSVKKTYEALDLKEIPVSVKVTEGIPVSRGLGSSSSCICAGVAAALIMSGHKPELETIINMATEIEGHPDNVVPAAAGGLTCSVHAEGRVVFSKISSDPGLNLVIIIPDFSYETEKARKLLPKSVTVQDAVYNMSRLPLIMNSLQSGNTDNLKLVLKDRLHQSYRMKAIEDMSKEYMKVFEELDHNTLGAYVSGAGPSIASFVKKENAQEVRQKMEDFVTGLGLSWKVITASPVSEGLKVIE